MGLGGTLVIPINPQSLEVFSQARKNADIEYAESDSDFGDDEERIRMHDDQTYPKTTWTTTNQHFNG
jgi:hypothetical protein